MSKYSEKIDQIYENLNEIKINVSSINQHLQTLNGKVADDRGRINHLETDNTKNKIRWARFMGIAATIGAIIGFMSSLIIKII